MGYNRAKIIMKKYLKITFMFLFMCALSGNVWAKSNDNYPECKIHNRKEDEPKKTLGLKISPKESIDQINTLELKMPAPPKKPSTDQTETKCAKCGATMNCVKLLSLPPQYRCECPKCSHEKWPYEKPVPIPTPMLKEKNGCVIKQPY